MATLYNVPTEDSLQYQLDAQLNAGANSLTLDSSAAGVVQAPGIGWVDRIDSSGNVTPTLREYFSFTGVSGVQLTGLTRGLAGSTDQQHSVGAIVEFGPDVVHMQAMYDVLTTQHSTSGIHTAITASTASTNIVNTNALVVASLASVRDLTVTNSITASGASLVGVTTMKPTWFLPGTLSGASANLGSPLSMPYAGTVQFIYATSRIGASNASVGFDVKKNGTSIIAGSNVFAVPLNGTFSSTASITTNKFVAGDVFTAGTLNALSMIQDVTLTLVAR